VDLPRSIAVLGAALLLAACGSSDGDVVAGPSRSGAPSAPAAPSPSAARTPALVLSGTGLGVATSAGVRQFGFGTPGGPVQEAVADVLGPGVASTNDECGAGPLVIYDTKGFQVLLDGTTFVGWVADERVPAAKAAAADRTAVGMALAQLRALHPDLSVEETTLGQEFSIGRSETSIGGFLAGAGSASKVSGLYAGTTCFFR
jgi:hypothetical protein